jgi:hypothetical protein
VQVTKEKLLRAAAFCIIAHNGYAYNLVGGVLNGHIGYNETLTGVESAFM